MYDRSLESKSEAKCLYNIPVSYCRDGVGTNLHLHGLQGARYRPVLKDHVNRARFVLLSKGCGASSNSVRFIIQDPTTGSDSEHITVSAVTILYDN